MKKLIQIACLLVATTTTTVAAHAADKAKIDERINNAHEVLHQLMNTPDKGIPFGITSHATCVAVVPSVKKAAFVVGGEYGQGVVTCRTGHGWSAPAFIKLTGASFGFQIGGEATDLVLISTTHDGFQRLLKEKVKLGGDIAVAAGPIGRDSQASTTALANAGFLTYSRNKGIFAGVDLNGAVINQNGDDTAEYYGHDITFEHILDGSVPVHPSAAHFVATVRQMFRESR